MSKQHDPQDQQRRQAVRRYMVALKHGDIATVAAILSEAEHDPALESLLLTANRLYQARDGITVQSDELLQARRFLNVLRDEARIGTNYESLYSSDSLPLTAAGNNGTIPERRLQPMQIETQSTSSHAIPKRGKTLHETRFPRVARFMQMAAAVLIVGVLIASFLFVFSMRHGATRPKETTTGSQFHGIVAVFSTDGFISGLDPQKGTVIWKFNTHEFNTYSVAYNYLTSSLIIQNQVVYAYIQSKDQNQLYALQASNGRLLWKKNLGIGLVAPSPVNGTLAVDHGILFVIANDSQGNIIYALRTGGGQTLWRYRTSYSGAIAAANGVVYVDDEVNGPYHPQLLALRGTDGKELWHYTAAPQELAVVGNVIYAYSTYVPTSPASAGIKQPKMLLALNAQAGSLLWSHPVNDDDFNPMGIANGVIVLFIAPEIPPNFPNVSQLCAYSSANGNRVWCTPPMAVDDTASTVMGGTFYISYLGNSFRVVTAFDMQDGKSLWSRNFSRGNIYVSDLLVTMNGVVYIAGADVHALNGSNGQPLWHANVGDVVAIAAGS